MLIAHSGWWLCSGIDFWFFTLCPFSFTLPKYRTKSQNRILHEASSIILNMYKTLVAESTLINSLLSLHFLHGVSISLWILAYPLHHLPLYLHDIEDMQETQNQEFQFKATSRATETSYNWKYAPTCWFSTPSHFERLG